MLFEEGTCVCLIIIICIYSHKSDAPITPGERRQQQPKALEYVALVRRVCELSHWHHFRRFANQYAYVIISLLIVSSSFV
jgi:hypothetical protein